MPAHLVENCPKPRRNTPETDVLPPGSRLEKSQLMMFLRHYDRKQACVELKYVGTIGPLERADRATNDSAALAVILHIICFGFFRQHKRAVFCNHTPSLDGHASLRNRRCGKASVPIPCLHRSFESPLHH